MADDPAFVRFRGLCLALPEARLTMTWGAPHFRVGDKIFSGWGRHDDGSWSFTLKLDKDKQAALVASDPRFSVAAYVGKHGWVSVSIPPRAADWGEIAALLEEGYRNVAPRRVAARLDRTPAKKAVRTPVKKARR
jgi:predicted DNA-binding protein (MmcQ/YjbR family)